MVGGASTKSDKKLKRRLALKMGLKLDPPPHQKSMILKFLFIITVSKATVKVPAKSCKKAEHFFSFSFFFSKKATCGRKITSCHPNK